MTNRYGAGFGDVLQIKRDKLLDRQGFKGRLVFFAIRVLFVGIITKADPVIVD